MLSNISTVQASKQKLEINSKKHFSYYKFNLIIINAIALPLLSVAGLNIAIDPYGIFATPTTTGINKIKPKKEHLGRLYKAFDIRRIKPTTILLGSSRVETGLNSNHPGFPQTKLTYNSGFQAANTYEILRYLEHAIAQQPELEQVILGIDFFMFNSNLTNRDDFSEARLGDKFPSQDMLNATLSFDALIASKDTLEANLVQPHQLNDRNSKITSGFKFWLRSFLNNPELYNGYQFDPKRLKYLNQIVNLCQQSNIDLKIFISPTHATQYEAIEVAGLWSVFEQWKREVVAITPVWDFSGYNSITTEKISGRAINYLDSSHYSQVTGDLILNRLLSFNIEQVPDDFGVYINPQNIELHLAKIRQDQRVWQTNNLTEVQLVREIKLQAN
ncbi:MAG: hypothetical protein Tsb0014_11130 [Pleurocapsa sp.]